VLVRSPWSFTWCPLLWRSLSGQVIYYLYGAHAHLGLVLDGLFSGGACLVRSYIISMVPMLTLVFYLMPSSLEELVWSDHILSLWCPCSPWSCTWWPLLKESVQVIYYLYSACAHLGLVLDDPLLEEPLPTGYIWSRWWPVLTLVLYSMILFFSSLFRLYCILSTYIVPVFTLVLYSMILFSRSL
jgi:hypothetical protein